MTAPAPRRQSINTDFRTKFGRIVITIGMDDDNRPIEVFITARGKVGTELDTFLYDLGTNISKAMQHD